MFGCLVRRVITKSSSSQLAMVKNGKNLPDTADDGCGVGLNLCCTAEESIYKQVVRTKKFMNIRDGFW